MTYEGVADPNGSINTTSAGKTNFWAYIAPLFGVTLPTDAGLVGHNMPGAANVPQSMIFDAGLNWFIAEGIPITPYDDQHAKNYYPMMKVSARNSSGAVLASTNIVLPVSDEMDCRACHASGPATTKATPAAGWVFDADLQRDYRFNILRLHDDRQLGSAAYASALQTRGYRAEGLYATATGDPNKNIPPKAILCAACHRSEALVNSGLAGVPPLTQSIHSLHAGVEDPTNGQTLDSTANRSACYRCHPGSETRCLRGTMGNSVAVDGSMAVQCQNCHGQMSAVGAVTRTGWLNEPACQNCHTGTAVTNSGQIRYTSALLSTGALRPAADATFATTPNTPVAPYNLYRFSAGHGGLQCSACHGSTHAEYPSSHPNDNVQSVALQGHVGTLGECTACHGTSPSTTNGGPHGMHPVGAVWVSNHNNAANLNRTACQACHGADYRGTVLSRTFGDRTLNTEFGTKKLFRGAQVGCYTCHNGPSGSGSNSNRPPVASNLSASTTSGQPVPITLSATDPDGNALTYRIVSQPPGGTVALSGTAATYKPYDGFSGTDTFTYAAWDGSIDSNLATVTVLVGNTMPCTVTASASAPASAPAGLPAVQFTGSVTATNCVNNVAYDWSFGDGTPDGTALNPGHVYASAGTYTWSLTASAGATKTTPFTGTITITSGTPQCAVTATASVPATGTAGTPVGFTGSATATGCATAVTYDWNFGDGSAHSSAQSPSHAYAAAGTYTWTFTAASGTTTSAKTGTITIAAATSQCAVTVAASAPGTGTVGVPVSFTSSATATNCSGSVAYSWTFGDGTAAVAGQNVSHTYATGATFQWRVSATASGVTATRSGSIVVGTGTTSTLSITRATALSGPLRIRIDGTGFQAGVKVYIGSSTTPWANTQFVSSTRLQLSGEGLSRRFPRGQPVTIRVVNPDGHAVSTTFTRQ